MYVCVCVCVCACVLCVIKYNSFFTEKRFCFRYKEQSVTSVEENECLPQSSVKQINTFHAQNRKFLLFNFPSVY